MLLRAGALRIISTLRIFHSLKYGSRRRRSRILVSWNFSLFVTLRSKSSRADSRIRRSSVVNQSRIDSHSSTFKRERRFERSGIPFSSNRFSNIRQSTIPIVPMSNKLSQSFENSRQKLIKQSRSAKVKSPARIMIVISRESQETPSSVLSLFLAQYDD